MNSKVFLRQLKKLDKMIENKLIEREQWKAIASGTAQQMGGERVQTSSNPQRMADAIARYIDMESEVDECIDRLVDTKKDVISVIEQLNATEYDLLHKVYVQYMSFDEVASLYDKSYSWVTTVNGRALRNVQKILDEREKKNERNKNERNKN